MSDPIERSKETVRASLKRTIATLHEVIAENRALAEMPGHEESGRRRVTEGEEELARAELELARLDDGRWPHSGEPMD